MAFWDSSFCQGYLFFFFSLGKRYYRIFPLNQKLFLPSKYISVITMCLCFLFTVSGCLEVVIYIFCPCGICLLYFSQVNFSLKQLRQKHRLFSLLIHISRIPFWSRCKSVDPPKLFSFWHKKKGQERIFWGLIISIAFMFHLLSFPLSFN